MSLIKMITGALTGGTGGIFNSDKEKNEGYKWKSGMDETHGGTTGLLNQATYTSPQANLPEGHKPLNLAEAGIIESDSGAYNPNKGTFPGGANAFVHTQNVKGNNQNMTVGFLDSILQQFNDMKDNMANMPRGVGDTEAIQKLMDPFKDDPWMKGPLNVRNNNPGNIKDFGVEWDGMINDPLTDGSFLKFDSPEMGVRALTKDLTNKMNRGLNTVGKIVNVYAPSSENDTDAYIDSVTQSMGIGADDVLSEESLSDLIRAIIRQEGGDDALQHYNDDIILKGMNLAY